jgi:hypothetical protein
MPPSITAIANRASQPGDTVSIAVSASTGLGGALSYSAAGLPPGVSIDASAGLISGIVQPTDTIDYAVVVTVAEVGNGSAQTSFLWWIKPGELIDRINFGGPAKTALVGDPNTTPWRADTDGTTPGLTANGSTVSPNGISAPTSYAAAVPGWARTEELYRNFRNDNAAPGPAYDLQGVMSAGDYKLLMVWSSSTDNASTRNMNVYGNNTLLGNVNPSVLAGGVTDMGVATAYDVTLSGSAFNLRIDKAGTSNGRAHAAEWYRKEKLPTISDPADITVTQGQSDTRALSGSDPNGGEVSYSAHGFPSWVTVVGDLLTAAPLTGTTPGVYSGTVRATKAGNALYAEQALTITVNELPSTTFYTPKAGVPPKTLARVRKLSMAFLTDRCSIQRQTDDSDGYYGGSDQWANVYENVPCRVIRASSMRAGAMIADVQEILRDSFSFEFRWDQPIAAGDRIEHDGVIFEVQRIQDALTDMVFKSVLVTRIS